MYDPQIGRWLTPDPIGFEAGDANLYRYVGNQTMIAVDPFGLQDMPTLYALNNSTVFVQRDILKSCG